MLSELILVATLFLKNSLIRFEFVTTHILTHLYFHFSFRKYTRKRLLCSLLDSAWPQGYLVLTPNILSLNTSLPIYEMWKAAGSARTVNDWQKLHCVASNQLNAASCLQDSQWCSILLTSTCWIACNETSLLRIYTETQTSCCRAYAAGE